MGIQTVMLVGLSASLACSSPSMAPRSSLPPGQSPQSSTPRLVVMIAIDQLPSWSFAKHQQLFTHGYRRLLSQGLYVPQLELPYALPLTAPGHASLSTGTSAVEHGVFGNVWFRRDERKERSAEWDPTHPLLRVGGGPSDEGASGQALRVEGIGDALKRQRPGAQVISLGLKARAACFFAGQHPDLALFYEPSSGGLITSTYYAATLPPWVVEFNRDHPFSQYAEKVWTPLDPALLARVTNRPDAAAGEGAEANFGITFPHALASSSNAAKAFVATPFGDELVLEAAQAAVVAQHLGADEVPDLLAISLNSHDFAGHNWGQESWEVLDLELRQDLALGRFFAQLDRQVGADHYAVVLTSDHGATPLIETGVAANARRIPPSEIRDVMEAAMVGELGPAPPSSAPAHAGAQGRWVDQIVTLNVYMVPAWRVLPAAVQRRSLQAAVVALRSVANLEASGIAADIVRSTRALCGAGMALPTLLCRSLTPAFAGELYLVPTRGSLVSDYKTGTHHDAPSAENRFVPLLMWGAGIDATRLNPSAPLLSLAVAPTVARILGISPPAHATEAALLK
ncbi:MAG: alkaline phosphatase family protein [Kofleriaceae bacterium]|nr:alkaline phosphatase family protein [Kofleriaceae bacterium]